MIRAGLHNFARVSVCCLAFSALVSGQQLARDFFDTTVVHDIHLEVDPADWDALKQNYLEDTYYRANVSSGSLSAANVGIRSRGSGSRSPEKPNLDINIDKYTKKQTFADLSFFMLKANNQDASLLHEFVAFELYRKMGMPAPREAPARLYINGEYFGFYMLVEHEDEDFLDRNLGEHTGDLFQWEPNAIYNFEDLGTSLEPYINFLDAKTNEDNPDYQSFVDMIHAINHSPDNNFISGISTYLDPKLYLTFVATENAIAEIDGLWSSVYGTNNIYLYRFAGEKLFHFIAWDKDLSFWQIDRPLPEPANNPLARRLLAIPEYHTFYLSQLAKAAGLLGGTGGWADQEVDRMYALMHDDALNDPHKQCIQLGSGKPPAPCSATTFEQGVRDMHSFIATRAALIRSTLAQEKYSGATEGPVISRVSSGPESTGDVSPGSIVTIRGLDFGGDQSSPADEGTLPRASGRSFVAVEGVRAPLFSISPSEIEIQIPWDIPTGTASISVSAGGTLGNVVAVPVAAAAPEILAVVHSNGTPVDAQHPAHSGETLNIYATGLGAVESTVASGDLSPADALIRTAGAVTAKAEGEDATVLFSGLSPGSIGLYQVNVTLPGFVPASQDATLSLSVDGTTASVSISIN